MLWLCLWAWQRCRCQPCPDGGASRYPSRKGACGRLLPPPEGAEGGRGGRGRACKRLAISPRQKATSFRESERLHPWSRMSSETDTQTVRSASTISCRDGPRREVSTGGVRDRCKNRSLNFLIVARWTRSSMARAVANKLRDRRSTGSGGPCMFKLTEADAGSASESSSERSS